MEHQQQPEQTNTHNQEETKPVEETKSIPIEKGSQEAKQAKKEEEVKEEVKPLQADDAEDSDEADDASQNWTDATPSIADDDDIIFMDDELVNAMDEEDEEEGEEEEDDESSVAKEEEKKEEDLEELEQQFVRGEKSEEHWRVGDHTKFCTSLGISPDGGILCSGGGDDAMMCFKRNEEGEWKKAHVTKHTQTVSKIQMSHDGKYAVSMTDNEVICTDLTDWSERKVDLEQPSDILCHPSGGVLMAVHGYTLSIINLKGLDLYTSYNLDAPADLLALSEKSKQIAVACQNKIRIISPKTGEIIKGTGAFHQDEINVMTCKDNLVYTGCIGGRVFASSLVKGTPVASIEEMAGTINCLLPTEQYLLVAPQGDGVHWLDVNKFKRIFHSPKGLSVTDIHKLDQPHLFAMSTLQGALHLMDRRAPLEPVRVWQAGNSIHKLLGWKQSLLCACEDGVVRGFELGK